jgi:hypothetical protein
MARREGDATTSELLPERAGVLEDLHLRHTGKTVVTNCDCLGEGGGFSGGRPACAVAARPASAAFCNRQLSLMAL